MGKAPEIREKRVVLGKAVEKRRKAQEKRDKCVNGCREIEAAVTAARPDQIDAVLRELTNRRSACQLAQNQSRIANEEETGLEKSYWMPKPLLHRINYLFSSRSGSIPLTL